MRHALGCLLDDHLDDLLIFLDSQAAGLAPAQHTTLLRVTAYLRRNRPFMDYHRYLALGWPIGTGVVEGACRHLVKDRFEQAGMRWSLSAAQTLLDLRACNAGKKLDTGMRRDRTGSCGEQKWHANRDNL